MDFFDTNDSTDVTTNASTGLSVIGDSIWDSSMTPVDVSPWVTADPPVWTE